MSVSTSLLGSVALGRTRWVNKVSSRLTVEHARQRETEREREADGIDVLLQDGQEILYHVCSMLHMRIGTCSAAGAKALSFG